jgi:hypothetical protein
MARKSLGRTRPTANGPAKPALEDGGKDLGPGFGPALIRITPRRIVGFGIGEGRTARNVIADRRPPAADRR